jgi:ribose transport system substrate-binding protein
MSQEKLSRRAFTIAAAGTVAGLVVGFGLGWLVKPTPTLAKTYRVAFSPDNLGSPYWVTCLHGAEKAVSDINSHFGREVLTMSVAEYLDDPDKQASHIDTVVAAAYDYYVAPAVVEDPSVAPLKKLHDAGIPALLYDRDTAPAGRDYRLACFITDNVEAGRDEVDEIGQALAASGKPKPWKIACLWGHPGASSAEDRKTGSVQELASKLTDATIVAQNYHQNWSRDLARADMDTWLVANPDLAAVISSNDDMAMGAIASITSAGKTPGKDVFVVGIDAIAEAMAAVTAGTEVATNAQSNYAMAYWGILGGFANVTMKWTPPTPVIDAPLTAITTANVGTFTLEDPKLDFWTSTVHGPTLDQLKLP